MAKRVVFTYARVTRDGVDIDVRVRMAWQGNEVVELQARKVLDETAFGEVVPLTDEEQDRVVIDSFGQGAA